MLIFVKHLVQHTHALVVHARPNRYCGFHRWPGYVDRRNPPACPERPSPESGSVGVCACQWASTAGLTGSPGVRIQEVNRNSMSFLVCSECRNELHDWMNCTAVEMKTQTGHRAGPGPRPVLVHDPACCRGGSTPPAGLASSRPGRSLVPVRAGAAPRRLSPASCCKFMMLQVGKPAHPVSRWFYDVPGCNQGNSILDARLDILDCNIRIVVSNDLLERETGIEFLTQALPVL